MNKKWLLILSLAGVVAISAACGSADQSSEDNNVEPETNEEETNEGELAQGEEGAQSGKGAQQPEVPEPDLADIPEVVAEVNGEEITKEEFEVSYTGQFQQMMMQAQMTGQEVDQDQLKKQLLDRLIGQELLVQEAQKNVSEVTQEEINELLNSLAAQNGLDSKEALMSALEEQGMEEAKVISQLEKQIKVDKLIAKESGNIEPTEEELQAAYDQAVAQQEQAAEQSGEEVEIPTFEEVKSNIAAQLKSQKQAQVTQNLVVKLRENADIKINL